MAFLADLHVHSHYSRATSRHSTLAAMARWGAFKGLAVVGSGDCLHPAWRTELTERLEPAEPGLYRLRPPWLAVARGRALPGAPPGCDDAPLPDHLDPDRVRFLLTGEVSLIYRQEGRSRRIHHLLGVPDLAAAERLARRLEPFGKLAADGRPMLGVDSRTLLALVLESDPRAWLIPAHVWTPWYALLGERSGFDGVAACFGDLSGEVLALETGLSSDPAMNRRVAALDPFSLVSFSDAHSPARLGREATRFQCPLNYHAMRAAMASGAGLAGTVEFFPEEGKYFLAGHRQCGVARFPGDDGTPCPRCGKPLTPGVLGRVAQLAGAGAVGGSRSPEPCHYLLPLAELLGELLGVGAGSRRVARQLGRLVHALGPELALLLQAPEAELIRHGGPLLAEAVARLRQGRVVRQPGYDGRFGTIRLFTPEELAIRPPLGQGPG